MGHGWVFYGQWKSFSIWLNFLANPNMPRGVKYFPDSVYCRNKHTFSEKQIDVTMLIFPKYMIQGTKHEQGSA